MKQYALGLIETVGLVSAIEAADSATKAANVKLIAYELTNGGGMVTVKITGDVAAVQAAVNAAKAAAERVGTVVSAHVIPRPHNEIETLIYSKDNVDGEKRKNKGGFVQKKAVSEKTESGNKKADVSKSKKKTGIKAGSSDNKTGEQPKIIESQEKPEITDTEEKNISNGEVSSLKKDIKT
ncbi:MAG: BMC domain-containing protein [Clostridia bacterium]|nr:BMC domain-containing protein [Clostridia bacterium]